MDLPFFPLRQRKSSYLHSCEVRHLIFSLNINPCPAQWRMSCPGGLWQVTGPPLLLPATSDPGPKGKESGGVSSAHWCPFNLLPRLRWSHFLPGGWEDIPFTSHVQLIINKKNKTIFLRNLCNKGQIFWGYQFRIVTWPVQSLRIFHPTLYLFTAPVWTRT